MSRIEPTASTPVVPLGAGTPAPVSSAPSGPAPATGMAGDVYAGTPVAAPPEAAAPDPRLAAPAAELTAQELRYQADGLLPAHYAQLKHLAATEGVEAAMAWHRQGRHGPFSPSHGDPAQMLRHAKRLRDHPEIFRLMQDIKKGDVIMMAYNSDSDIIANATRGPFAHAIVCSEDGPPPEFIEAVGVTGDQRDPSCNKIRRSGVYDHFWSGASFRRLSPAGHLPEPERTRAVDAAVRYCEQQLGKPYDYTFGENGVGRSFYCSSLAYYAYVDGAKLPIAIDKAAQRDSMLLALDSMMDALAPKDRAALMDEIARTVNTNPPPSTQALVSFAVERVLPACGATAALADTEQERRGLQAAIARFGSGQGLPRYQAKSKLVEERAQSGAYRTPVLGWLRRQADRAGLLASGLSDAYHAFDGTGLSKWDAIKATSKLVGGFLPFSEAVTAFVFGKDDSRTRAFGKFLDATGWLKSHKPFSWVSGWLPGRGTNAVNGRFISPTDLAWAQVPKQDYNLRPGQNLDQGR